MEENDEQQLPATTDHEFTPQDVSDLAAGADVPSSDVEAFVAQADSSTVAKNRRKMLLKLLILLREAY